MTYLNFSFSVSLPAGQLLSAEASFPLVKEKAPLSSLWSKPLCFPPLLLPRSFGHFDLSFSPYSLFFFRALPPFFPLFCRRQKYRFSFFRQKMRRRVRLPFSFSLSAEKKMAGFPPFLPAKENLNFTSCPRSCAQDPFSLFPAFPIGAERRGPFFKRDEGK